jgi:hypothetical protein
MKRFSLAITIFLACVIAFGILVLLDSLFDTRETKTNLFFHYYSIEPESLLAELNTGKVDVFSPIAEEPPSVPPEKQLSVLWTQDDYFRVVNALFQFARDDTLHSGWQLEDMHFSSDCEDNGFYNGNFHFFKVLKTDERESRIERIINIDPPNKVILITENEYYPILTNWSGITLDETLLSADEALPKAENAGGKEKRLSVQNACYISLLLNQDVGFWNNDWWWWAHYSRTDDEGRLTTLFSVDINPYTGEIRP